MERRKVQVTPLVRIWIGTCLLAFCLTAGCTAARQGWTSYPAAAEVKNPYFEAQIRPARCAGGNGPYQGFFLYVKNLSREPLDIDWDKTYYIEGRENKGGFIVGEGELVKHPYFPWPPRRIEPGHFFQDNLWPRHLASAPENTPAPFDRQSLKPGTHGVYLTVLYSGNESAALPPSQTDNGVAPWNQAAGATDSYIGSARTEVELPVFLPLSIVEE